MRRSVSQVQVLLRASSLELTVLRKFYHKYHTNMVDRECLHESECESEGLGQLRVQLPGSDAENEKMGANEREQ